MQNKITIVYYLTSVGDNPVKEFIDSLSKKQKAKIFRIFQYMQGYGLQVPLPHIKKLTGTPLWEIRILGQDNIRIIYVVPQKDTVLVLHGFIKKRQKIPSKEIDTALNRFKEWQTRVLTNDI